MESVGKYSMERKAFDTPYRLRRLNSVRRLWGMPDHELDTDSSGATVGIEIEMTWPQAFPSMEKWDRPDIRPRQLAKDSQEYADFCEEYDQNDRQLKPLLNQIERVIPRIGRDAYWEFSFLPTKNVSVLMAEVDTLYENEILRPGVAYATHLTLSGIANDRDAYAILMLLELEGGATSERLTESTGWARKGTGGLLKRLPGELVGDDIHAYEFRTMVTTGPQQLRSLLELAQQLEAMHRAQPQTWLNLRAELEASLTNHGLPLQEWCSPADNPELWQRYSDAFVKKPIFET